MEKIHQYLWIMFVPILFSCENREEIETRILIHSILKNKIEKNEAFYFSEDAYNDWNKNIDICSIESFLKWKEWYFSEKYNEIKVEDIFSNSDFNKICKESTKAFKFTKVHVPKNAKLIPQKELDKWMDLHTANVKDGVVLTEDQLRQLFVHYYRFSKPVFLKNYKYAFIYYSNSSFSRMHGSSAILFYEKVDNVWMRRASYQVYMA